MARIKYTKKGQPYIIQSNGRAKFIKKSSSSRRRTKTTSRGAFMAKRKSYSRKSSGYSGMIGTLAGAAAYGAVRSKLSNALKPMTDKIPLGNISDEVAIGVLAILAKKTIGKKMPIVHKVADAALVVEAARIGEAAMTGQLGGMSTSSNDLFNGGNY
jgi:hypothetical protein